MPTTNVKIRNVMSPPDVFRSALAHGGVRRTPGARRVVVARRSSTLKPRSGRP
jgi:hypothetical protein